MARGRTAFFLFRRREREGERLTDRLGSALRRFLRAVLPPALLLALGLYFIWQSWRGELGLAAYQARRADLLKAEAARAAAARELAQWQARITALRTDHLDPDLLDERVRALLNLANPDELVVPLDKPATPPAPPSGTAPLAPQSSPSPR